ncbi:MAG: UDP-N-acetylmuramoyl-L-alanine--D-glutamate ligase [Verrucomicrobiota bacterium JB024]|nr:UDP-N-acetylmuramoyl-L-alanine--D-glutamate ligase [Verrucomicrobiota bacterium JB024]
METPDILLPLLDRPAAIFGSGVSGRAAGDLLRSRGRLFEVYDERGGQYAHRQFGAKEAARHGLVVHSPGFAPSHPWFEAARKAGCMILGELDFASLYWGGGCIAVTGTNGKTTVTEFLAYAFKRAGQKAVAVGNIGYPMSRLFELSNHEGAVAVCEVSSFQSENLKYFRPQSLIWTNFDEDHLDRYATQKEYFDAKWRLVEQLSRPSMVVGESVARWAEKFGKKLPPFCKVVRREDPIGGPPASSPFLSYPQQENYRLVRAFWEKESMPVHTLESAASQFRLPRHRLQKVAEWGGVAFWNDSKATNFASALAALKTFQEPVVWIGGGKTKGGDIPAFVREVAPQISSAVLLGETAPALAELLAAQGVPCQVCKTLPETVTAATDQAKGRGVVLLSPGFSSLDMFESYTQRGFAFEQAVLSLKKQKATDTNSACAKTGESLS